MGRAARVVGCQMAGMRCQVLMSAISGWFTAFGSVVGAQLQAAVRWHAETRIGLLWLVCGPIGPIGPSVSRDCMEASDRGEWAILRRPKK
jgi:hypothetical protein